MTQSHLEALLKWRVEEYLSAQRLLARMKGKTIRLLTKGLTPRRLLGTVVKADPVKEN